MIVWSKRIHPAYKTVGTLHTKTKLSHWFFLFVLMVVFSCDSADKTNQAALLEEQKGTFWDYNLPMEERVDDLISRLSVKEKTELMKFNSPAIPRLDIPAYNWWNEALHGVARFGRATVFPQPIGMAASFDKDLIYHVGTAISDEARAKFKAAVALDNRSRYTGLTFWSPNVNIFRDPRWGRGMETWGEDPYLTGELGGAFVDGMQGDHPKYLKTAACAKHYVVHSGPEADRHRFNAKPPIKDFHETYLPAFKTLVVDHHVEAVMCAYNRTFDEPCCGSSYLLTELLRNQWGFEGHILSDCGAIRDFHRYHQYTGDQYESAALAVKSGVNLNCGQVFQYLYDAYEKNLVSEELIDERLSVLLKTRFKLGLFDPPAMNPYNDVTEDIINCKKHKDLALEAAQKSVVMLKNANNTLPLSKSIKNLIVVGPNAANVDVLLGNYHGYGSEMATILEGITGKIHPGTKLRYHHGFMFDRENINEGGLGIVRQADATIVVMGLNTLLEGEEGSAIASPYKSDRKDLGLPGKQLDYLKKIRNRTDKPVVVVLNGGSPLAITEVHELADAILYAWYPGEKGGNAVGDVIFGDVSPSGRLPITFPKSTGQLPPYEDYSMEGRTYKYMKEEPLYPFGYGLSYATFEYSDIQINKKEISEGDSVQVTFKVKNIGKSTGDEVVQLYVKDEAASFRVPQYSLGGFKRVSLEPNETKQMSFTIHPEMMKMIDDNGESVTEPGTFRVFIGGSSPGKRSIQLGAPQPLETTFTLK